MFVLILNIVILSQDESEEQDGLHLSCPDCCTLYQIQLSKRSWKELTPLWEQLEIFRGVIL